MRSGAMSAPSTIWESLTAEPRSPVPEASLSLPRSARSPPIWPSSSASKPRSPCTSLPESEVSLGPSASVSRPEELSGARSPPRMLLVAMSSTSVVLPTGSNAGACLARAGLPERSQEAARRAVRERDGHGLHVGYGDDAGAVARHSDGGARFERRPRHRRQRLAERIGSRLRLCGPHCLGRRHAPAVVAGAAAIEAFVLVEMG